MGESLATARTEELIARYNALITDLFSGYMGARRKELVKKFHYDPKAAAHLVRLLRMSIEFLNDGVLYVERYDAQQLLEIKRGEWTLEQVKTEAARLFSSAEQAYLKSSLPPQPDRERVNALCVEIVQTALEAR